LTLYFYSVFMNEDVDFVVENVKAHHRWFQSCLPMIASENLISPVAREMLRCYHRQTGLKPSVMRLNILNNEVNILVHKNRIEIEG
ncbi:MAG: hypothetical protein KJ886_02315, partial [Candidatus Thermoplasmatota archaeon]|nr:hypothetical protein [Candidatus Thermoplasmatota archaeon]